MYNFADVPILEVLQILVRKFAAAGDISWIGTIRTSSELGRIEIVEIVQYLGLVVW